MIIGLPCLATYLISGRSIDLERCDLVGGRIEPCEQVDGSLVKGRGKNRDPKLTRFREHLPVPLERRVGLLVELMKL